MGGVLGGGGGGGAVVQSTNPMAAQQAGQLQSAAASQASQLYSNSINQAIQALNNNYNQSAIGLQPQTQTGVAALDQLNQYLGLPTYNPGTAPVNPNTYTPDQSAINNYIKANSNTTLAGLDNSVYQNYTGVGAAYDGHSLTRTADTGGVPTGMDLIGYAGSTNVNASQKQQITDLLKQQYVDANKGSYQTQLSNYNNAKGLYDKYQAQGPMTQAQITQNIQNQPGYQSQLSQGIGAIGADASAKGYLGSGAQLKELMNYGQNTFSQYYGDQLSRLAGLVTQGTNAQTTLAGQSAQQGNSLANLYNSLGQNQANAALASGGSQAQNLINANQQYSTVGGSSGGLGGLGSLLGGGASLISAFGGL